MFGLYLVDALRQQGTALPRPEHLQPVADAAAAAAAAAGGAVAGRSRPSAAKGRSSLQDVYASWPPLPPGPVKRLRIVQVLPKTTPHANDPTVGLANASPGKQVLGTVPVEADGSAYFRAPAGHPAGVPGPGRAGPGGADRCGA